VKLFERILNLERPDPFCSRANQASVPRMTQVLDGRELTFDIATVSR
jgi:hypothetical protein